MSNWELDYVMLALRRTERAKFLQEHPNEIPSLMKHYAKSPWDWIEDWCITYDPRNVKPKPKIMAFMLFQRQREFIQFLLDCLDAKESGLVEKSRDMGATWLCCAFSLWMWLFHPGSAVGWGSRKEQLVDRLGDPDSIFQKMRMILDRLPNFMLPQGFNILTHATFMKIVNPVNGSIISGEAGDNIGRGGRKRIYFKDESAHYERPERIEAALGDNTDVQIDISSVHGTANVFYRRRMAGEEWEVGHKTQRGKVQIFIFDWRDNPLKTQEWYDMRRKKAEDEGLMHVFAQEVDRDYTAAIDKIIIEAKWVNAAIDAHIRLKFKAEGERTAGQDIADAGGDKNAYASRHGVILQRVQDWGGDAGDATNIAIPNCVEDKVKELYYDSIGVGSGFKTAINKLIELGGLPPGLRVMPWNAAESPLDPEGKLIPGDLNSPLIGDFFANLKAQAWWSLRTRFYKTWRAVEYGEVYPFDELISIPKELEHRHKLQNELSQAIRKYTAGGKVLVDKQPEGTKSPNLADAVVMCYFPVRNISSFDIM